MYDNEPVVDGPFGLPDGHGFLAVLEAEEQRAKRHGGIHGLVLIQLRLEQGEGPLADEAAVALSRSLRETDLLAQINHRTFGVLALHCHALEPVVARLEAALETVGCFMTPRVTARYAGAALQSTWVAMISGDGCGVIPPTARYIAFVASLPQSLN